MFYIFLKGLINLDTAAGLLLEFVVNVCQTQKAMIDL